MILEYTVFIPQCLHKRDICSRILICIHNHKSFTDLKLRTYLHNISKKITRNIYIYIHIYYNKQIITTYNSSNGLLYAANYQDQDRNIVHYKFLCEQWYLNPLLTRCATFYTNSEIYIFVVCLHLPKKTLLE